MTRAGASLGFALCTALLAAPALAVDVLYQVQARQDVRARTPLPGDTSTSLTTDMELAPEGQVAFVWSGTTTLGLQYAPQLLWREPQLGGRFLPLHRGRVGLEHRWGSASVLVTQEGTQGTLDLGSLRNDPDAPVGSLPPVVTLGGVPYVRSATLLSVDARPTEQASFQLQGGYFVSGSTDPLVVNLPLQYGPAGSGSYRHRVSRVDTLVVASQLLQATFVSGHEQFFVTGLGGWERLLWRTVTLLVQGGVGGVRGWKPGDAFGLPAAYGGVVPALAATLSLRDKLLARPVQLELAARLTPFSDRFTGFVYERFETQARGEWRPDRDWTVTATAGFAYAVPLFTGAAGAAPGAQTIVFGEGTAAWAWRPWLLFGLNARVLMSQLSGAGAGGQFQAVTALSVTVREQDATAW